MEEGTPRRTPGPRANKPLTEKKRRLRINASLEQIKCLVMDALGQDPASVPTKFEKADILELAVRYLQNQRLSGPSQADLVTQYCEGYQTCIRDVTSFLSKTPAEPKFKQSMLDHLDERFCNINSSSVISNHNSMMTGGTGMDYTDNVPNILVSGQPLQDLNQNIVQNGIVCKESGTVMRQMSEENMMPRTKTQNRGRAQQQQQQQHLNLPHIPMQSYSSAQPTSCTTNLVSTMNPTSTTTNLISNVASSTLSSDPQTGANTLSNSVSSAVYSTLAQDTLPPIQSFAPGQGQIQGHVQAGISVFDPLMETESGDNSEEQYQTFTVLQPVKQENTATSASQFFSMYHPNQGYT